eukprot:4989181-Pleurochrysis_carterae.AAC.2
MSQRLLIADAWHTSCLSMLSVVLFHSCCLCLRCAAGRAAGPAASRAAGRAAGRMASRAASRVAGRADGACSSRMNRSAGRGAGRDAGGAAICWSCYMLPVVLRTSRAV